jgi:hypothetical protein
LYRKYKPENSLIEEPWYLITVLPEYMVIVFCKSKTNVAELQLSVDWKWEDNLIQMLPSLSVTFKVYNLWRDMETINERINLSWVLTLNADYFPRIRCIILYGALLNKVYTLKP